MKCRCPQKPIQIEDYLELEEDWDRESIGFTSQERELIISALINDRVGNWGDGRQERIDALVRKIKGASK